MPEFVYFCWPIRDSILDLNQAFLFAENQKGFNKAVSVLTLPTLGYLFPY